MGSKIYRNRCIIVVIGGRGGGGGWIDRLKSKFVKIYVFVI